MLCIGHAGVLQVGIKYGGKGDVDITGLEMELREPYKVCMIQHVEWWDWSILTLLCDDGVSKR